MPSHYETFFDKDRYAVVGHSQKTPFPKLTYRALKAKGKTVYAIDPSAPMVEGDPAYAGFDVLPGPVEAVVLEVRREETATWVTRVAEAGVKDLWIHMKRETPEALAIATQHGIDVRYGTCAVMYLRNSYHTLHRWIRKLLRRY